jgi:hypothetical protein
LVKFLLILFTCFAIFLPGQVFSSEKSVARLTEFSGTVLIKSQGSWGLEPQKDFLLYSDDKVVTRTGKATITFNDGMIIKLSSNSNLLIMEQEEEKGFFRKVMFTKRSLRLLVGKLSFVIGKIKTETTFETATAVCGIRGTAGTLSIGADGQNYIQFTEGGAKILLGDFITGVAEDVPTELADKNPAQRAVFVAKAAADQAIKAAKQIETGEITKAQGALIKAQAAEAASREVKIQATIMLRNPDPDVVDQANQAIDKADDAIEKAIETQEKAIDAGAVPGIPEPAEPFEPEAPGFDIPVDEEPPIQDTEAATRLPRRFAPRNDQN